MGENKKGTITIRAEKRGSYFPLIFRTQSPRIRRALKKAHGSACCTGAFRISQYTKAPKENILWVLSHGSLDIGKQSDGELRTAIFVKSKK